MKCYIGIDLGSTTTKAVVLDEAGRTLGRGITNSRSNYDVACEVARHEALMDVRFNLLAAELDQVRHLAQTEEDLAGLMAQVRSRVSLGQYLNRLEALEETCRMNGAHARRGGAPVSEEDLRPYLDAIFQGLREEATDLFLGGKKPRSDFFRDIAGSGFMAEAEQLTRSQPSDSRVSYELLLGLYDKSIITVENEVPTLQLRDVVGRALDDALAASDVAEPGRRAVAPLVGEVIDTPLTDACSVGTGYGRARLPFPKERIRSEILCHGLGAHATFPGTRTVLDIGGQDTKAIQVDESGIVTSFQMNDRCAAGCGRYLGYIADEMNLGLHELGPLAQKGKRPVRINSTCTVFAGAEFRDRLAMGQRREDILAGLHRAIMLRAMSLLARSGGVEREFTFTGGVANNGAAVDALRLLVQENYEVDEINISPESIYTGALGAALFALRAEREDEALRTAEVAGGAA